MNDPLTAINTRETMQTDFVPGRDDQVRNNAGGVVFEIDKWQRALRFLVLGTSGGTYYVSEKDLTKSNSDFIIKLANTDGVELVNLILDVSEKGRAPRQNPTLFALAACCSSEDLATRRAAFAAVSRVCRIGTHLFIFSRYVEQFRGWGRGLRSAIGSFYTDKSVSDVGFQAVKYRQREGWSHRDLLRLSHPQTDSTERADLFDWVCRGYTEGHAYPEIVNGYELAQHETTGPGWAKVISEYRLPWEALPDAAMNKPEVWEALLPHTGVGAIIRQLGRLTNLGVIAPLGGKTSSIVATLTNADVLKKARIHPLQVLTALKTYQSGHGWKGTSNWVPNPKIIDALNEAFHLSFGAVEPANKRTLLALDVSGSMGMGTIANSPLTPREASAALAMVHMRTEPEVFPMAFSRGFIPLNLSANQRLDDVLRTVSSLPFDGTDCSVPMIWAGQNKVEVDTFVVVTDNETWSGRVHPLQALKAYREYSGIPARLVVVGMTATQFSIADPTDSGSLDVVGFDTATPNLISAFSRGEL